MTSAEILARIGDWLGFASLYGAVMLGVASLANRLLRRGTAAQRARVWWFALLSTVFVPVVRAWQVETANLEPPPLGSELVGPSERTPLPAPLAGRALSVVTEEDIRIVGVPAEREASGVPSRGRHAGAVAGPMEPDRSEPDGSEPVEGSSHADPWALGVEICAGVWLMGAVLAWIRLFLGFRSLSRIRYASRTSAPSMRRRFDSCRAWLGVRRAVDLRVGDGVRSPVLIGGRSVTVVLPTEVAAALDDKDLDAVFLHELAHAARGDDWARLVERAIVALFWFHPAIRIAARCLDEEREMACDDMAAGALGSRRSFAHSLLRACEVAVSRGSRPAPVAPAAFRDRGIGDRIRRLVQSPDPGCPAMLRAAAGLMMLGAASVAIGAPWLVDQGRDRGRAKSMDQGAFLAAFPGSSRYALEEEWTSGEHGTRLRARYCVRAGSGAPFGRVLLDRTDRDGRVLLEGIARARGPVEWILSVDGLRVTNPRVLAERGRLAIHRATSEAAPAVARELRTVLLHFGLADWTG